ncbi:MAG: hypothetical protein Q4A13_00550, partial [Fretibacterium sp.]|nr:hypothetical protein [Fretibacterium sp.]
RRAAELSLGAGGAVGSFCVPPEHGQKSTRQERFGKAAPGKRRLKFSPFSKNGGFDGHLKTAVGLPIFCWAHESRAVGRGFLYPVGQFLNLRYQMSP